MLPEKTLSGQETEREEEKKEEAKKEELRKEEEAKRVFGKYKPMLSGSYHIESEGPIQPYHLEELLDYESSAYAMTWAQFTLNHLKSSKQDSKIKTIVSETLKHTRHMVTKFIHETALVMMQFSDDEIKAIMDTDNADEPLANFVMRLKQCIVDKKKSYIQHCTKDEYGNIYFPELQVSTSIIKEYFIAVFKMFEEYFSKEDTSYTGAQCYSRIYIDNADCNPVNAGEVLIQNVRLPILSILRWDKFVVGSLYNICNVVREDQTRTCTTNDIIECLDGYTADTKRLIDLEGKLDNAIKKYDDFLTRLNNAFHRNDFKTREEIMEHLLKIWGFGTKEISPENYGTISKHIEELLSFSEPNIAVLLASEYAVLVLKLRNKMEEFKFPVKPVSLRRRYLKSAEVFREAYQLKIIKTLKHMKQYSEMERKITNQILLCLKPEEHRLLELIRNDVLVSACRIFDQWLCDAIHCKTKDFKAIKKNRSYKKSAEENSFIVKLYTDIFTINPSCNENISNFTGYRSYNIINMLSRGLNVARKQDTLTVLLMGMGWALVCMGYFMIWPMDVERFVKNQFSSGVLSFDSIACTVTNDISIEFSKFRNEKLPGSIKIFTETNDKIFRIEWGHMIRIFDKISHVSGDVPLKTTDIEKIESMLEILKAEKYDLLSAEEKNAIVDSMREMIRRRQTKPKRSQVKKLQKKAKKEAKEEAKEEAKIHHFTHPFNKYRFFHVFYDFLQRNGCIPESMKSLINTVRRCNKVLEYMGEYDCASYNELPLEITKKMKKKEEELLPPPSMYTNYKTPEDVTFESIIADKEIIKRMFTKIIYRKVLKLRAETILPYLQQSSTPFIPTEDFIVIQRMSLVQEYYHDKS
eukprot:TRINITY_DN30544_c0_g1_i1.p1 TRINITY_DN30544_c0_g1~~TRINITY_DN30544_c0_g1_i1.p1  ORF type:complete len:865 (+),score=87.04 TRINITY_DN30544_c0_g1_i1:256-2850(+)